MASYNDTDQLYGWNGSTQTWRTYAEFKTQLMGDVDHDDLQNIAGGGTADYQHLTSSQVLVIEEVDELNTANGFDLTDIPTTGTVTWDDSARKFTISPTSGETEFHYWIGGTKYTKTAAMTQAVAIPDVTGTYYAELSDTNLNGTGEITAISQDAITQEVFYENAIVGLVYWNATLGIGIPFREQHGHRMDSADHEMEHNTIGARYSSGFRITGLVDAQDTFTGVESGRFYDEDIPHNIPAATTLPFMYRLGPGDGEWTWSTADNKVGFFNGGSYATWNEDTGTTWQLTQANSAHDFILHFVVATATLDGYDNFAKIIDQEGYSSRSNARDAIEGAKKKLIIDGLPSPELCFLGVYICRRNGDLEELADGSVYLDLRGSSSRGSGGDSATSNIAADIVVDASGFAGNLSSTDTDTQTALETIDAMTIGSGSGISLLTSDPSSPATDDIWINTTDNQLKAKTSAGTIIWDAWQYIAD